jgi:hypothetical protein
VPPRVTGFFSDFAYDSETGDISGTEIFISYARIQHGFQAQHYAYVQIAEGVPAEPQLVPVTVNGTNISFTLSGRYARISPFSGAVTGDSLVGQFSNGVQIRLPRRASYWR